LSASLGDAFFRQQHIATGYIIAVCRHQPSCLSLLVIASHGWSTVVTDGHSTSLSPSSEPIAEDICMYFSSGVSDNHKLQSKTYQRLNNNSHQGLRSRQTPCAELAVMISHSTARARLPGGEGNCTPHDHQPNDPRLGMKRIR
jgi:hypothetical protein